MSVNDSDLEFEERPQKQRQERKKLTGNNVGSWQRTNSSCSSVSSSHSRSDGRKKPTGDGKKTYEKPKGTNCELCGKQLSHMSQTAQLQHVNSCLDSMEELWDLEQKIQNWEEIVDCPICSKPLLPGPVRLLIIPCDVAFLHPLQYFC